MRTTLKLDDQILKEAKRLAMDAGKTLGEVVEDLLREALHRRKGALPLLRPAPLPSFSGGGLLPGVDLSDTSGLLDRMEGR